MTCPIANLVSEMPRTSINEIFLEVRTNAPTKYVGFLPTRFTSTAVCGSFHNTSGLANRIENL